MTEMDKVPVSAAVNESANLARAGAATRPSTGFVNGVLRGLIRKYGIGKRKVSVAHLAESELPKTAPPHVRLAVKYSFQDWMAKRWITRFGAAKAEEMMRQCQKQAPVFFRLNRYKETLEEIEAKFPGWSITAERFPYAEGGYILKSGKITPESPIFTKGYAQPQDGASMIAASLLAPKPKSLVADVCCGKGIKSGLFAQAMENKGIVVCMDNSHFKLTKLKSNMRRQGMKILRSVAADATIQWPVNKKFDAVYIDAPCSGFGLFRRHPEGKWNKPPQLISEMAAVQWKILQTAGGFLVKGGRLVYSVCSMEIEEGEEQIDKLLAMDKRFKRVDIKKSRPELSKFLTAKGDILILPGQDGMDGFFATELVFVK